MRFQESHKGLHLSRFANLAPELHPVGRHNAIQVTAIEGIVDALGTVFVYQTIGRMCGR